MRKGYLSAKWVQWQRYRYQGCIAEGLAAPLAHQLATAEASWRHRASKVIGFKAACAAELIVTDNGFGLTGNLAGLSDDQIKLLGGVIVEPITA